MPAHRSFIVGRLLLLVFATISMFGCATGSAIAHTAGALAVVMDVGESGHTHGDDAATLHGLSHHHTPADHTHDTPSFPIAVNADWPKPHLVWSATALSLPVFRLGDTLERPPRG